MKGSLAQPVETLYSPNMGKIVEPASGDPVLSGSAPSWPSAWTSPKESKLLDSNANLRCVGVSQVAA
jgi:hypothetical protein